jgi:hypothetical protein
MFTSKWIIYSCAIALIVGAAIISPLLILNTVSESTPENPNINSNPQSPDGQIGVNIKSVQANLRNITPIDINSTETVTQPAFSGTLTVNATKYLNNNQSTSLAESDLFLMQIFTDNGTQISNCTLNIGTAYNESFTPEQHQMFNSSITISTLGRFNFGEVTFTSAWPIGTSQEKTQEFSDNISPGIAALINSSQNLTVTISRIGTITIKNTNVSINMINEVPIETVTLTRNGNTFTYNA